MEDTLLITPQSYLSDEERAEILREEGADFLYIVESQAADEARDEDSSWAWLARAELPHYSLKRLKRTHGADWIRKMGFKTATAEAAYGTDWLDRP